MSLKPQLPQTASPEIATWGTRHLLLGNPYRFVGDDVYAAFHEIDFADVYHAEGKPALSPVLLALVTIFQAFENLSDRAAVNAVRTRLECVMHFFRNSSKASSHWNALNAIHTRRQDR